MNLGGRLPGAAFAFASVAQARYRWLSDRRTHPPASSNPETTDLTGVEQARTRRFGSQASEPIAAVGLEYRRRTLFRVSCLQKLRNFHQFSAQALISNAEVEFEELTRLSLRDEFTPILRFGGLLRLDGGSFLDFQLVEEPRDRDGELQGNAVES